MKFNWLALLLLLWCSRTLAQNVGDVMDVQLIDELQPDSRYSKIWQPFIARWSDKQFVVVYGRQLKGKTDMGDIVCSISKDKGKTWTPPIYIFNHQVANGSRSYAYGNAVLFKSPDQNILWCFAMRCPQHYSDSEDSELCAAYSGDGGFTWYQVELFMDFHSPVITNAGIVTMKDGEKTRYLLPVHRNTLRHDPRGDRQQFVLESHDLLHWKLAGYIPQIPEKKVFLHEGNVAATADRKELKMVMRTSRYDAAGKALDPPRAYSSVSKDGGKTWSPAKVEESLHNTVSKGFFQCDSRGWYIYVYNDGSAWERRGLYYKVKFPERGWSDARTFYFKKNRNSYPTLIEESPGVYIGVWDSSNDEMRRRTAIRFGRLDLNQIFGKAN